MSSYLLAFFISDFVEISNEATKSENETLQRIWTRPDSVQKAQFALQHSIDAFRIVENYLGVKCDMQKIDSIAVPGAIVNVENWGMPTYQESALIYETNSNDITHDAKFNGVLSIFNDVVHQFIGNSATNKWWDYVW